MHMIIFFGEFVALQIWIDRYENDSIFQPMVSRLSGQDWKVTPFLLQMLSGWVWLSSPENDSFNKMQSIAQSDDIVRFHLLYSIDYWISIEFLLLKLMVCVRWCFPTFSEFVINTKALATSATSAGICRRRVGRQFDQFASLGSFG